MIIDRLSIHRAIITENERAPEPVKARDARSPRSFTALVHRACTARKLAGAFCPSENATAASRSAPESAALRRLSAYVSGMLQREQSVSRSRHIFGKA
jgi:hypothetical protein